MDLEIQDLEIQDLQKQLAEKDKKIKELENELNKFKKQDEQTKLSKKKYYEANKDLIIEKAKESRKKLQNENPELFKERNRVSSLKSYYKRKQQQEH